LIKATVPARGTQGQSTSLPHLTLPYPTVHHHPSLALPSPPHAPRYTDSVEVALESAMELFEAADRFGVERLRKVCEAKMLGSICVDNAAAIFHAADANNARSLREKCLNFILAHFDAVTKTQAFEEMGRINVDLVFEILQKR